MLIPCLIVSAVLGFSMLAIENTSGIFVFAIFYGFSSGACESSSLLASWIIDLVIQMCP